MLACVSRDVNEHCRCYIVYRDLAVKRLVVGAGFRLGSLTIKLKSDYTATFIPYPPHSCNKVSLHRLLFPYGTVKSDSFQQTPGGTRIGGYTFMIDLHQGRALPPSTTIPWGGISCAAQGGPAVLLLLLPIWQYRGACQTKKADVAAHQTEREELHRHQQQQSQQQYQQQQQQ